MGVGAALGTGIGAWVGSTIKKEGADVTDVVRNVDQRITAEKKLKSFDSVQQKTHMKSPGIRKRLQNKVEYRSKTTDMAVKDTLTKNSSWFKGSETTSSSGTISGARNVHSTNSYDRGKHTSNVIKRVDASQVGGGTGPRYYQGSGTSRSHSLSRSKAGMNALRTMISAPQDSVRAVDLPAGVK